MILIIQSRTHENTHLAVQRPPVKLGVVARDGRVLALEDGLLELHRPAPLRQVLVHRAVGQLFFWGGGV